MKYNYKLLRSQRKTISLKVTADNKIIVHAPNTVSVDVIEAFIEKKSGWLDKKLAENERNLTLNADIVAFRSVLVGGKPYKLEVGKKDGVSGDVVSVGSLMRVNRVFVGAFGDEFLARANSISEACSLKAKSMSFKSYKGRWGCCDASGKIFFSYKLLMLPKDLQDYVIVHELCHLKHMDHSVRFWSFMASIMPDCRERRNRLKEYNFISRLYP